ncbi:hypothetical protein E4U55_001840 [Claviceps digitariae]|nr:hypothetical protein E4U55_001840 [Claviceps digitariae]
MDMGMLMDNVDDAADNVALEMSTANEARPSRSVLPIALSWKQPWKKQKHPVDPSIMESLPCPAGR